MKNKAALLLVISSSCLIGNENNHSISYHSQQINIIDAEEDQKPVISPYIFLSKEMLIGILCGIAAGKFAHSGMFDHTTKIGAIFTIVVLKEINDAIAAQIKSKKLYWGGKVTVLTGIVAGYISENLWS